MDDRQVVIDPRNATLRCKAREVSLQAVQAVESARDGEEVTCSEKPLLRFAQGQRERERARNINTWTKVKESHCPPDVSVEA